MTVETDINKRWEQGTAHHPESIRMYQIIESLEFLYARNSFDFKHGGDGDNGETLMYLLDIHYETIDRGIGP